MNLAYLKLFHLFFLFLWLGSLLIISYCMTQKTLSISLVASLKRLYLRINLPSMILALGLGILIFILKKMTLKAPWLHMKLTAAFFLIFSDVLIGSNLGKKGALFYRVLFVFVVFFLLVTLFSVYILKT